MKDKIDKIIKQESLSELEKVQKYLIEINKRIKENVILSKKVDKILAKYCQDVVKDKFLK